MNRTGKQLVESGIIFGNIDTDNIQQHGVDLNLIEVRKVTGFGFIPKNGKTILAQRDLILPKEHNVEGKKVMAWFLEPGVYDVTMLQGCKLPSDVRMKIVHRSSLFRNGGQLNSALFDAGFETGKIGTLVTLELPILIEEGARVAQIYADESNVVNNLYNGQWQNDQQRANGGQVTQLRMHENDSTDYAR